MSTLSFVRATVQRRAIRAALEKAGRPLSPEEIQALAKTEVPVLAGC